MDLRIILCAQVLLLVRGAHAQSTSDLYSTRFPGTGWNNAEWQLTTTHLDQGHYQARMSVANGYHGINVASLGPFFEVDDSVNGDNINGWPLFDRRQTFATVGGFWDSQPTTNGSNFPWLYQYGGDSAISGIPHWGGIVVDLGGSTVLDASTPSSTISNFTSTLDMKQGLMNWAYTWTPPQGPSFEISYQIFAHRLHANQGLVNLNITATKASNVTIVGLLNGDCATRTNFQHKGQDGNLIYSAVSPHGVDNVTAYIYAGMTASGPHVGAFSSAELNRPYIGNNESSIAQHANLTLKAGQTASIYKFVGIASSDGFTNPQSAAKSAAMLALTTGYASSLQAHTAEWALTFPVDSVDDYSFPENGSLPSDPSLIEAQIMAVVNPYQLLQQTLTKNAIQAAGNAAINSHSISVGGLASDSYAGQVFWDAEIWMQPGLVASFPFAGRGIANYRLQRYHQALENIKTAYQSSKKGTHFSPNAAVFSWTSGRYGNCTATGPCFDYEYHINGDIAQEFANYWVASGDTDYFKSQLFPVYDSLATFYSDILTKNGSKYTLTNMTDPDEYANAVDNGGFTMPLIANTLATANYFRSMFGTSPNTTWNTQAQNVLISRDADADVTLEYTSMNGSISVKQADVVLNTYPLSYTGQNYTTQDSLSDLDYYAAKQSPNGPGMTYAIFSIVANQVSPSGCSAYTYQRYSEQPYVRGPWFQMSEQLLDDYATNGGTHPAYPFLTGHGGANQVVLFGYLGYRLEPDFNLHIDPALPPQIPQISYRTFYWHGWAINATSNQTHTTLSRIPSSSVSDVSGAVPNTTFASAPIPVLVGPESNQTAYSLPVTGVLVILNRRYAFAKTVAGNAAQCQAASSPDEFVQGQFPIAAIDGALSTKWQPVDAGTVSSITVSLPAGQKVMKISFDWAQTPPVNYTVMFHNGSSISSSGSGSVKVAGGNVKISVPYNAKTAADIVPYSSNTTSVDLSGNDVYTAQYATLSIYGSLINGTKAATKKMSGAGATVAEWNIVVAGEAGEETAAPMMMRRGVSGEESARLQRVGRFMRDPRWR